MTIVAISCPPAIIDAELRQVCESPSNQSLIYPGRSAAHQSTKRIEVYRGRSMGNQVRVEKLMVSDFIIRVVVNVLRHVLIKRVEGVSIECIACPARYLGILDSAKLVVLNPKVGFQKLCCRGESQQRCVARCQTPVARFRAWNIAQQAQADC